MDCKYRKTLLFRVHPFTFSHELFTLYAEDSTLLIPQTDNYKTGMFNSRSRQNFIDAFKSNKKTVWFIFALFFVRSTIINYNHIPSASMNPNLIEGDVVLVNKLAYDIKVPFWGRNIFKLNNPKRGDVVAFDNNGTLFVKRVLALPGDTIQLIKNVFYVNGKELNLEVSVVEENRLTYSQHFKFLSFKETNKASTNYDIVFATGLPEKFKKTLITNMKELIIPEGSYFMIGDNRNLSQDSRYFGPVQRKDIVGHVGTVMFNYRTIYSKILGWIS